MAHGSVAGEWRTGEWRVSKNGASDTNETNSVANAIPGTKAARHALLIDIIRRNHVRSQTELIELLAGTGIAVTQATLSRDLVELGAIKVRTAEGSAYAVPGEGGDRSLEQGVKGHVLHAKLQRHLEELLVSATWSANLAVLRTPPGAAQFLASTIDHSVIPEIIGTIAGDDTVLIISADPQGGKDIANQFICLAGAEDKE